MPGSSSAVSAQDTNAAFTFYQRMVARLCAEKVPFLVGGAYALGYYTGIERHTKDFDIFVERRDYDGVMQLLADEGCITELTYPHWLGKARCGDEFIDVIFSSGNGVASVDEDWFRHAPQVQLLGHTVSLCPAEEMIWSKGFVMERERFDGADIIHLIRALGPRLDWPRLLQRFGPHWRVLMAHVVLFGFTYPNERHAVPEWVITELCNRLHREALEPPGSDRICHGTLVSRAQYRIDIEEWGYSDGRCEPHGTMSDSEVEHWTAAIDEKK